MSHEARAPGGEPGDEELVRLLDGEVDPAGRERLLARLAADPAAAERLAALERNALRLRRFLADEDAHLAARARAPRPRPAPRAAPWLRAAAAVVLLLAGALAAPPLWAWLSGRPGGARPEAPAGAPAAAGAPAPAAPAGEAPVVRFVPVGGRMEVELASAPAGGALELRTVEGAEASAQVVGASEAVVVLREGVRVLNAAGGSARYRVSVPAHVTEVRVRVGGRDAGSFRVGAGSPRAWTVPLGTSP
jgi:hypothetical protein